MKLLTTITLEAPSQRQARYLLSLYELDNQTGFVIEKRSGAVGHESAGEWWYRPTRAEAEEKYFTIIRTKTGRRTGRRYREIIRDECAQLPLIFPSPAAEQGPPLPTIG